MNEKSMLLLRELKQNLTQIFTSESVKQNRTLRDSGMTNSLLLSLENILCHGLKSPFLSFFSGPASPWPWIEGLPQSLPKTDALMADLNAACGTVTAPFAKVRLFLRFVLNAGCIHECMQALCWNQALTASHYEIESIIRDPNMQFAFLSRLEPLEVIQFDLETLSIAPILARPDYWRTIDFSAPEKQEPKTIVISRKNRYQKKKVSAEAAAAAKEAINKAQMEAQSQTAGSEPQTAPQTQPVSAPQAPATPSQSSVEKDPATVIQEKQRAAQSILESLIVEEEERRKLAVEMAKRQEEEDKIRRDAEEAARKKREELEKVRLAQEYVEEESMLVQQMEEMKTVQARWEQQLDTIQHDFDEVLNSA